MTLKMAAPATEGDDSTEERHHPDDHPGGSDSSFAGDVGRAVYMGPLRQLHSATGHNLAISQDGEVYGTRERYTPDAVMLISAVAPSEVQIKGQAAELYIAMNARGKIYAEEDPNSDNTVWIERYNSGYNNYIWRGNSEVEWFLGIKKSGKMKRGEKTRASQKAVRFLPRPPYPQS